MPAVFRLSATQACKVKTRKLPRVMIYQEILRQPRPKDFTVKNIWSIVRIFFKKVERILRVLVGPSLPVLKQRFYKDVTDSVSKKMITRYRARRTSYPTSHRLILFCWSRPWILPRILFYLKIASHQSCESPVKTRDHKSRYGSRLRPVWWEKQVKPVATSIGKGGSSSSNHCQFLSNLEWNPDFSSSRFLETRDNTNRKFPFPTGSRFAAVTSDISPFFPAVPQLTRANIRFCATFVSDFDYWLTHLTCFESKIKPLQVYPLENQVYVWIGT